MSRGISCHPNGLPNNRKEKVTLSMNCLFTVITSLFLFSNIAWASDIWVYMKYGPGDADGSACVAQKGYKSIDGFVKHKLLGSETESCVKSKGSLTCKTSIFNNTSSTEYFYFPSEELCKRANVGWERQAKKLSEYQRAKGSEPKSEFSNVMYFWSKSTSGNGCYKMDKSTADMFRSLCKVEGITKKKVSLDCAEVPDMEMAGMELYSDKSSCLEEK